MLSSMLSGVGHAPGCHAWSVAYAAVTQTAGVHGNGWKRRWNDGNATMEMIVHPFKCCSLRCMGYICSSPYTNPRLSMPSKQWGGD
eukprot:365702-Chlamydomonas_euryale.AAC.30